MASSIPLFTQYYYSTYVRPNLAFLPLFARQRFPSRSILFLEKKSVAKAKIFFLMIQSEILSRPRHPPLSFKIFTDNCSFFLDTVLRRIPGVSLPHGCRLPISRMLGEKAGPSPAREKNPFFLRSHAVQLARVSRKKILRI